MEHRFSESAQLALDTILHKPTRGIPSRQVHVMEHACIERLAGAQPGDYARNPKQTYLAMQRNIGTCFLDQCLWDNPLTMGSHGYDGTERTATTGAENLVLDGMLIDSPEAVVEHMERFAFPRLASEAEHFDEETRTAEIVEHERAAQETIGPEILKGPHAFIRFPHLAYATYGYVPYFSAVALYPEVIEKHFSLEADVAVRNNRAAAKAFAQGRFPPIYRLDHDMADSRGTLVRMETLDQVWFPHFCRALEPMLKTNVRLVWHCDGNLMEMVPRLIECGIRGFQGFQYEDGMDYERICRMKTSDGEDLTIMAGVSVTRTLPMGTPADVKREIDWLVEHGPRTGLFLGASSSVTPGVPWENISTLVEGLRYYRGHGRAGEVGRP